MALSAMPARCAPYCAECSAAAPDLPAEQRERDRHLHIVVPVDRRCNRLDDALADARVLSEGADRVFIFLCQPER